MGDTTPAPGHRREYGVPWHQRLGASSEDVDRPLSEIVALHVLDDPTQPTEQDKQMTRTELIEKATTTLDEARETRDAERADVLTRVAMGYAQLLNFAE